MPYDPNPPADSLLTMGRNPEQELSDHYSHLANGLYLLQTPQAYASPQGVFDPTYNTTIVYRVAYSPNAIYDMLRTSRVLGRPGSPIGPDTYVRIQNFAARKLRILGIWNFNTTVGIIIGGSPRLTEWEQEHASFAIV